MIVLSKTGLRRAVVAPSPDGCAVRYEHRFNQNAAWQHTRTVEMVLPMHAALDVAHCMIGGI